MDQESFRRLLQTARPTTSSSSPTTSRGSITYSTAKAKVAEPPQSAFKPRKVKKNSDATYRDRAAERRTGGANDYAQVEAVLEDFERRTSNSEDKSLVEEQRKYLGGDSDHSILVKGLDVALLEQNKARAAISTEDDDSLEQAYLAASTEVTIPKKRTREDLVRELKQKREQKGDARTDMSSSNTAEEEIRLLEDAKKRGKFKPIGAPLEDKSKKKVKREGKEGEKRKKKRKVEVGVTESGANDAVKTGTKKPGDMLPPKAPVSATIARPPVSSTIESEPEPIEDIFADAGEYDGLDLGDDDEDQREDRRPQDDAHPEEKPIPTQPTNKPGQWFATDDEELPANVPETLALVEKSQSLAPPPPTEEEVEDTGQPTRLMPLHTSALPSIKDFLAMDEAAEAQEKRRKRKDKRKGGKGGDDDEGSKKVSAEAKAERDYKRLKTYTEKKTGGSGTT